jgi:hypothetical protein
MDSTACLVGPDAPHVDLSLQFLPAGQRDMQEDNPIPRHLKLQVSLVAANLSFFRLRELGTHARVRHISLYRNAPSREWSRSAVGQFDRNRGVADPGWFRRDFILNRDMRRRLGRSGTADHEQTRSADEPVEN